MEKSLLLIDGHALLFREFYALERTGMRTSEGQPTWAVYGFLKVLFEMIRTKKFDIGSIAVAFDVSHQTFRVEKYDKYKSNRSAMPDDMRPQLSIIKEALEAFNIPVFTKVGFEADDIIGTISKKMCDEGHKVYILTGDQDSFQLIDKEGCVNVIIPQNGVNKVFGWDEVFEKLGVYPNRIIDYKALRGDVSDCIPGIKGIGSKTAQTLLTQFDNLDGVLEHANEIESKSVREKIQNGVEDARLSYMLATIVRDLDVEFRLEDAKICLPDPVQVTTFLKKMQFHTFIKDINGIISLFNPTQEYVAPITSEAINTANGAGVQLGLFAQPSNVQESETQDAPQFVSTATTSKPADAILTEQDLEELSQKSAQSKEIIFDIKYDYKNAVENEIIGLSIGVFEGEELNSFYIPFKHEGIEEHLEESVVLEKLKPYIEDESLKKICFDCKNLYNILRCRGITLRGVNFDVKLASYVAESGRKHDLDIQAMEVFQYVLYSFPETDKIKAGKLSFSVLKLEDVLKYVGDEFEIIKRLKKYREEHLSERELKILNEIELPLSEVLADMEFNGVAVDVSRLKRLTDMMQNHLQYIDKRIYQLAKFPLNPNSPKQVKDYLTDVLKVKMSKKSTSSDVLEELAPEYPIVRLILKHRQLSKLKNTYTEALAGLISPKDGRIHTTFNQTATTTGRLSSSNPNLQNIPVRTPIGRLLRKAFVAEDAQNFKILSADYSQIELRLMAHYSQDEHLRQAFIDDDDIHARVASKVFGVPMDKVTPTMRRKAKTVNFGIIYGQGKNGLAKSLGITPKEAGEFIEKYFEAYPSIKNYMNSATQAVLENGWVETAMGRKRNLRTEIESSNFAIREFAKRAAINHPLQGTAADLMKLAMIACYKQFKEQGLKSKIILQVHDEIVVEVPDVELERVKEIVKKSMELDNPLSVPLKVDMEVSCSWEK